MKLLSSLSCKSPSPAGRVLADASPGGSVESRPDPGTAVPDATAGGCGWFESSHELRCGLQVTEHTSADSVANDLPIAVWLAVHLASGPSAHAAVRC